LSYIVTYSEPPRYFGGHASRFKHCSIILRAARQSTSFWTTSRPSAAIPPYPRWSMPRNLSLPNCNEGFAGRVYPSKVQEQYSGSRLPHGARNRLRGYKEWRIAFNRGIQRFDIFLTIDNGLEYEQNLAGRNIAILLIRPKSTRLVDLLVYAPACLEHMLTMRPGQLVRLIV
jgi:hypothetical protein